VGSGAKLSAGVRDELLRRIVVGDLPTGTRLPPEPALASELGVSRATLREALRSLEEEGALTRTPGAGTFVSDRPRLVNNLDVNFGVTEAIRAAGMVPGTLHAHVQERDPSDDEARRLGLPAEARVFVIERVRAADGRPVVFSRDLMDAAFIRAHPDLARLCIEGSIYDALERDLGRTIHHGVASFRPVAAPADVAARLGVGRGTLLLYLRQIDYDLDGAPVLYSHEYHLADAFEFTVVRRGPGRRAGA
jgi:GntR family transcriptional regulator